MKKYKIGIIGGTGWMGKAMGDALLKKQLAPEQLWVSNASGKNPYAEKINFTTNPQQLVDACDAIILSVLPKQFSSLQFNASSKLVISIMAMVDEKTLTKHTQATRIIRAMPNAAIPEGESYTPWHASSETTIGDKKLATEIFTTFGEADAVANEDQLNFFTALTGSSHGWLAYVAQALIETGVEQGISEAQATRAIRQVMKGVGALIAHEAPCPKETVKILTDYAGTTAAGLLSLSDHHVDKLIKKAMMASYHKASNTTPEF